MNARGASGWPLVAAGGLLALVVGSAWGGQLTVDLAHGSEAESATRGELEQLTERYDLSSWLFTRRVVIDERAIPHSHPVLTLHTRHLGDEELLLSTFLHEQLHWLFSNNKAATDAAKEALRGEYDTLPVGYPDGARDLDSSYLHLLVILFEYDSVRHFLAEQRAQVVMRRWAGDHYRKLYEIVLEDHESIRGLAARHGFRCCPPAGPGDSADEG